jgi:hypothetical protein
MTAGGRAERKRHSLDNDVFEIDHLSRRWDVGDLDLDFK